MFLVLPELIDSLFWAAGKFFLKERKTKTSQVSYPCPLSHIAGLLKKISFFVPPLHHLKGEGVEGVGETQTLQINRELVRIITTASHPLFKDTKRNYSLLLK